MSNLKKSTFLVAASIFAISGIALASPKADTNNDGQITRAESVSYTHLTLPTICSV